MKLYPDNDNDLLLRMADKTSQLKGWQTSLIAWVGLGVLALFGWTLVTLSVYVFLALCNLFMVKSI